MLLYQILLLFAIFEQFRFEAVNRPEDTQTTGDYNHTAHDSKIWLQHNVCAIRYSFREITRNYLTCDVVKERNPICGRNITVVYSSKPPYAFEVINETTGLGTGRYKGVLFGKCYRNLS